MWVICWKAWANNPIPSMYGIFTHIYHILPLKNTKTEVNIPYMDGRGMNHDPFESSCKTLCVFGEASMSMFSREKHPPPQKKHQTKIDPPLDSQQQIKDRRRSGLHFCIGSLDSTSSSWHCGTSSLDDSTDQWKDASHDHPMMASVFSKRWIKTVPTPPPPCEWYFQL